MLKRIIITFLLVWLIPIAVFSEITRKTDDGKIFYFYSGNKKIAKETFDEKGNVKRVGKIPDGIVKRYNEFGRLSQEWNYKNNKRNGLSKSYRRDGKVWQEGNYENDKVISEKQYELTAVQREAEREAEREELIGLLGSEENDVKDEKENKKWVGYEEKAIQIFKASYFWKKSITDFTKKSCVIQDPYAKYREGSTYSVYFTYYPILDPARKFKTRWDVNIETNEITPQGISE